MDGMITLIPATIRSVGLRYEYRFDETRLNLILSTDDKPYLLFAAFDPTALHGLCLAADVDGTPEGEYWSDQLPGHAVTAVIHDGAVLAIMSTDNGIAIPVATHNPDHPKTT